MSNCLIYQACEFVDIYFLEGYTNESDRVNVQEKEKIERGKKVKALPRLFCYMIS